MRIINIVFFTILYLAAISQGTAYQNLEHGFPETTPFAQGEPASIYPGKTPVNGGSTAGILYSYGGVLYNSAFLQYNSSLGALFVGNQAGGGTLTTDYFSIGFATNGSPTLNMINSAGVPTFKIDSAGNIIVGNWASATIPINKGGTGNTTWILYPNGEKFDTLTTLTGGSTNLTALAINYIVASGPIVTCTLALPGSPTDGETLCYNPTQSIGTLSFSGGTVVGEVTSSVPAGTPTRLIFVSARNIWRTW